MPYVESLTRTLPGSFLVLAVGGLAGYALLCSASYAYFFVLHRDRYFPGETPDREQTRRERAWSVVAILGNAVMTAPISQATATGRSRLYPGFLDRGAGWAVGSMVVFVAVTDTAIYWIHRALHVPVLYASLHKVHHRFRVTTPWASFAFHPVDAFAQALPYHVCALLVPAPVGVYYRFLAFVAAWSVAIHDRVSILRFPWLNYTGHHTLHHRFNKYNYGQFFTLWDRLCGTYRQPSAPSR